MPPPPILVLESITCVGNVNLWLFVAECVMDSTDDLAFLEGKVSLNRLFGISLNQLFRRSHRHALCLRTTGIPVIQQ